MFHDNIHLRHLRTKGSKVNPMNHLYVSEALYDAGLYMLAVFTLTYFYYLGWSLPVLIIFMLLAAISQTFISRPLANFLLVRYRITTVLIIGGALRIVYLTTVLFLGGPSAWGDSLLFLIAILSPIGLSITSVAGDAFFAINRQKSKSARQVGLIYIIGDIVGFSATLVAGLIAQAWGFGICLVISSFLVLLSVCPFLFIKEAGRMPNYELESKNLRFSKYWQIFKQTPKRTLIASLASINVSHSLVPIWFLYLSIVIFAENTYANIGLISAVATLVAVISTKIAGKITDRDNPKSLIRRSAWTEVILGLSRPFIVNAPLAFGHNIIQKQSSIHSVVSSNWYLNRSRQKPGEMLAFFQMCSFGALLLKAIILLIILLLLLIFEGHQPKVLGYSTAGLGVLFGLFILQFNKQK